MKRIFPLGLLALLVIGCSSIPSVASSQKGNEAGTSVPTRTAQSNSNPSVRTPRPQSQNAYRSAKFGFRFESPTGYVVDNSQENQRPRAGEPLQGTIELWKSADYEAIKKHNFEGSEYPPNISIAVYNNSKQQPLSYWKDTISIGSNNVRNVTVAGQDAIAYTATGLYESDNILLFTPNRQRVIRLSRSYHNASDPSQQAFQQFVSSFTFNN